jgi:hypothetical protein
MKRTDIRAGVVYAIKSSYGAPAPIVFLEDGAAGLYGRGNYGRGAPRKLDEDKYTKARAGKGFSDSDRGYAAIEARRPREITDAAAALLMSEINPQAEMSRFLADERPSEEGLRFVIVTSLTQIGGLYDEELAAYEARKEAERAADQRKSDERGARIARIKAAIEALSAYGIRATGAWGEGQVELSPDEAEKLLALLAAKNED